MKGWTLAALKDKGIAYKVTGGVSEPVTAPKRAGKKREPILASRNRPAVDEIVVEITAPPSANHCWANVQPIGRVRSGDYRRWHKDAAQEAGLARGRIEGPYTALIQLGDLGPNADVDNRTKPTLDMLAGLLTDDDLNCQRATAEWSDDVPARRVRVTLRRAA